MEYLVWSKKRGGAWYRPESSGYTINPDIAGRYPESVARGWAVQSHGDLVAYAENSSFVARKRNEYMRQKQSAIRSCLETMTPQQFMSLIPELVAERIDMLVRQVI